MADPLLEDKYPVKGLYQALAVAAMCLAEEDSTRPLISDVVTAVEYLALDKDQDDGKDGASESHSPTNHGNEEEDVAVSSMPTEVGEEEK